MGLIIAYMVIGYFMATGACLRMYDLTLEDEWMKPHWSTVLMMAAIWPIVGVYMWLEIMGDWYDADPWAEVEEDEEEVPFDVKNIII